jgi:hypothetical protein
LGVDVEMYRSITGTAMGRWTWKRIIENGEAERISSFLGIVLVLLVVGGLEVNPGPPMEPQNLTTY